MAKLKKMNIVRVQSMAQPRMTMTSKATPVSVYDPTIGREMSLPSDAPGADSGGGPLVSDPDPAPTPTKKKKSNKGMMIAVAAGAAFLLMKK